MLTRAVQNHLQFIADQLDEDIEVYADGKRLMFAVPQGPLGKEKIKKLKIKKLFEKKK